MIKNDKQYQVTRSRRKDFQEALVQLETIEMDPLLRELQTNAIRSQIESFDAEIAEYDELKKGKCRYIEIASFSQVSEALIKARIGTGLTQAELAARLEMKEQQIQRYESSDYAAASMARLTEVASVLGMRSTPLRFQLPPPARPPIDGFGQEDLERGFEKMISNGLGPQMATA
jgi:transcriptional regulator with XRE-family HTH domain